MIGNAAHQRVAGRSTAGTLSYLLLGPLVWAVHFTVLYVTQSTLCSLGQATDSVSGMNIVTVIVTLATGVAFGLLAVAMLKADLVSKHFNAGGWPRSQRTFHTRVMVLMAVLAAFAIAAAALAAIFIETCSQLR